MEDNNITELEDGSALVELEEPEEEVSEPSHYDNLADSLDAFTLNSISSDLLDLIEQDKKAREERDKQQEEGIRRTGLGDDAPGGADFSGASRVVHPVLAEGCVDFSARGIKELFPANGPVKTKVNGQTNEQVLDKARRKRDFLNFYLTNRMPEYRSEKEILLTQLPLGGSQYEKYWFDGNRIRMEFVPIDKVYLPYAANSFYTASRITHEREVTEEYIEKAVAEGFYSDVFSIADQQLEKTSSQEATEKIEGKAESGYNEDGIRVIYEVTCLYDVEGEGPLPYVIHIDGPTEKVCAVYRNWHEEDPMMERLDWWVENKFIPWRGAYGIGLPHLIGGLSAALTGSLRALLDSAHINNAPTAIKLKGSRTSGQNITLDMTTVTEIEAPAGTDDIRKVMMAVPFNPPSNVLFQLLDWITNQAKGVVATAEERISESGNNLPVGTALALIEQGSQVFSSIHSRLHDAQRRALKIICRLISDYPEHVMQDLQRYNLTPGDFKEMDDVEPVSDPNIFSETQRYAQMQSVLQLAAGDAQNPEIPWNKLALRRRMLELLRVDGIDELLPKPPVPVTSDPVTENISVMNGKQVKPDIVQDHMAHIKAHLMFIMQPMIAQSDGANPQFLALLLGHVQEHLLLSYQHEAMVAMQMILAQNPQMSPDQAAMNASQAAIQATSQIDSELMPVMKQASDLVKSKMPPPQTDPAVQATKDVAMAQIQQKDGIDKAKLQLETQKFQFDTAQAQQTQQLNSQLQFLKEQREQEALQFKEMMANLRNEQDNKIHQITELLKNRDDNDTKVRIEELKQEMSQIPNMMQGTQDRLQKLEEAMTSSVFKSLFSKFSGT